MAKSIVTGGAGFIGSALAARLHSEGFETVVIDSLTDYYDVSIKQTRLRALENVGVDVVREDLLDLDLGLLEGADTIYHLAGQPGVRPSWGKQFDGYIRNNIAATQRLLEASSGMTGLKKFVYASSSSVYGDAKSYPTRESDLPMPMSPYGVTKLAAEHLCSLYAKNYQVPTVALRYFTVYGPGQRPDMAFHKFLKATFEGAAVDVYGDGEQIRDFTFVDDVVAANIAVSQSEKTNGQVYNVCGGGSITVNETLSIIGDCVGNAVRVNRMPPVPGDVRQTGGSADKLFADTGWRPRVEVAEGIKRETEWLAGHYGF